MSFKKPTKKEEEARKRLELISLILFDDLLSEEEAYLEGVYVITVTWGDVIQGVNDGAAAYGMPGASAGDYEGILDRALNDYRSELGDLKEDYAGAQDRINKTIWYTVWTTHNQAIKDIAKAAGHSVIKWNTQEDPQVCPICELLAGVYNLNEPLPEMPQHINCRCFWTLPEAARDALDSKHARYMAKLQGL